MNEIDFLVFFSSLFDNTSEEFEMDTEFRYLDDWSSMIGLCFITDMKDKYGKVITPQEFKEAETIGDLYNIYINK